MNLLDLSPMPFTIKIEKMRRCLLLFFSSLYDAASYRYCCVKIALVVHARDFNVLSYSLCALVLHCLSAGSP